MNNLSLKIPPPIIMLFFGIIVWFTSLFIPSIPVSLQARLATAVLLVTSALCFIVLGVKEFNKSRTTVNPMQPNKASSLVVTGVYKITRNPMYVGLFLVLLSWSVFLSNISVFVGLIGFVLYMNEFQIKPEEEALTAIFGEEFLSYRQRVRRWL